MQKSFFLAAEVIARRLPLIAGEAALLPGALLKPGHPESSRMVSEKVNALGQGMFEAGLQAAQINMQMGFMAMVGDAAGMMRLSQATPKKLARAFTRPARQKVAANAKRLRKRVK